MPALSLQHRIATPLLLGAAMLLSACVASPIRPSTADLHVEGGIRVVPIEAPPLLVDLSDDLSVIAFVGPMNVAILNWQPSPDSASGISSHRAREILTENGYWSPSQALAVQIHDILESKGIPVEQASRLCKLPSITNRDITLFLENWLGPIREWYNSVDNGFACDQERIGRANLVLEAGISNYEIVKGHLFLQVHLKLLDAGTGRVLGRDRAGNPFNMPNVRPLRESFSDNARIFKSVFDSTAYALARESLSKLGLIK